MPARLHALRRESPIVGPREYDMKSLTGKTLESFRRDLDADRLLIAEIVPQLVAGGLIREDDVFGPDIASNKFHQLIHVLVPLLSNREQVAALERSECLTADHYQKCQSARRTREIPDDPG